MLTPTLNCRVASAACLLILLIFAIDQAHAEPVPFRATYKADYKGLPVSATGIRELTKLGENRFLLSSTAESFFASIVEQSVFQLDENDNAMPLEYQYHRTGIGKNRHDVLAFDWANMKVENQVPEKSWNMGIDLGVFDKLLYQYQMRTDLKQAQSKGQSWPALTYHVADKRKLKRYDFEILQEETVKTGIGHLQTLKITRKRPAGDSRITTFWLALEYDFMLVRFQQLKDDGSGFELLLSAAEFDGKKIEAD
ncbi:MAG: DUF3108 domain-containing protein [Pseudomonadales bacterium]|nr:DUF3108 domain-containing protein [Pseudomonadales bacterium]MDG1000889.1 DUF3108 domain-containing protein [Pseudomonadales bacterium]MDG1304001.1 DUF3108 domain-containing protein [Pseudomonadales bacterium]MDG1908211.1 DUF3108 domain-containing protein [Pseudomonadales bacterium]|tara:strand:- start:2907 stop:3665 length:759 start_codon:yes stop_codon:yes gene_type:complete